jgi:putative hydrolase of the HAD superfamily
MRAYRAVLFDFFGTLTQSVRRGPLHATIACRLGCEPTEMTAILDRSFLDRSRGAFGDATETMRWVCTQAGARPRPDQLRRAVTARVAAIRADTALRPDAMRTLRRLRRHGLRTAVVSDCGYELPTFLPHLPIGPLLNERVYSIHVRQRKPHPLMYLTACDRLGVTPAECLYVGDGGSRELTGAADVGMTAVRLDAPDLVDHLAFDRDEEWSGPTIDRLADAVDLATRATVPG